VAMGIPSAKRREIIHDGSTAASMRQTFASAPLPYNFVLLLCKFILF